MDTKFVLFLACLSLTAPSANALNCTGFSFLFEYVDIPSQAAYDFVNSAVDVAYAMNPINNGFFAIYILGGGYYPAFTSQSATIRYLQNHVPSDLSEPISRTLMLQLILDTLRSNLYRNYGFYVLLETEIETDYNASYYLALEISKYSTEIYVLDGSNTTETSEIVQLMTGYRADHVIKYKDYLDATSLFNHLNSTLVPSFNRLGCTPMPTPNPSSVTPPPRTTTTHRPRTTTTSDGVHCSTFVLIQEMTSALTTAQKTAFFDISNALVDAVNAQTFTPNMQFAYAQYGSSIYEHIKLTDYSGVKSQISSAADIFDNAGFPNGNSVYLAPMLSHLINVTNFNPNTRVSVLITGEMESIRDPTSAYRQAGLVNADVYVLDYSQGAIPLSIWPTLTDNKLYHIVDGSSMSTDDIVTQFTNSLVSEIVTDLC